MKKQHISILALSLGFISNAQNLQDAINKTENECFEAAAADFRSMISKDGTKGDYYFYYGENYFKNNNPDSAFIIYKKGSEAQPTNPLNYIGLGRVLLQQGKDQDANANLFKGKTLDKKNANAFMKLAEVYIDAAPPNKNFAEANKLLADVMKLEPKNPEAHILMGDALLEQNPTEGGPAIKEYDKALELNPKSPKAVLREGKLYKRARNYNLALDYYKKAITIDPNFAPAYMEMAELYHLAGQESKALEAIKKYLEIHCPSISARKRYASFLFLNKQYPDAIKEIEDIIKKDPTDPYMYRILGYAYFELGDKIDKDANTKGRDAINKFFELTEGKNFKYIAEDYKYKGLLLAKSGQDSLGAAEIEKAIAADPVKNCELNGEIGKIYIKSKKYDKAILYYEKKAQCPNVKMTGADYFDLGRAYFYGPKDFVKADTCFSRLTQLSPAFATGYFLRGNANVQLDPKNELWLAKPHYEKAMTLVKPEERTLPNNKNYVIVASEYLGYYYLKNKDNAKAKEYFNIIKELDPNNKKTIEFFKSPEGK